MYLPKRGTSPGRTVNLSAPPRMITTGLSNASQHIGKAPTEPWVCFPQPSTCVLFTLNEQRPSRPRSTGHTYFETCTEGGGDRLQKNTELMHFRMKSSNYIDKLLKTICTEDRMDIRIPRVSLGTQKLTEPQRYRKSFIMLQLKHITLQLRQIKKPQRARLTRREYSANVSLPDENKDLRCRTAKQYMLERAAQY